MIHEHLTCSDRQMPIITNTQLTFSTQLGDHTLEYTLTYQKDSSKPKAIVKDVRISGPSSDEILKILLPDPYNTAPLPIHQAWHPRHDAIKVQVQVKQIICSLNQRLQRTTNDQELTEPVLLNRISQLLTLTMHELTLLHHFYVDEKIKIERNINGMLLRYVLYYRVARHDNQLIRISNIIIVSLDNYLFDQLYQLPGALYRMIDKGHNCEDIQDTYRINAIDDTPTIFLQTDSVVPADVACQFKEAAIRTTDWIKQQLHRSDFSRK